MTSAGGANAPGRDGLLALDEHGQLIGPFCEDPRLVDPGGMSLDPSGERNALAAAHLSLHPADAVFYFSLAAKRNLLSEPDQANVRRLTQRDRDAFAAFVSSAPAHDLDDAYVELDHWVVFGAFREERLVCATSMYPWGDSDLKDLGVIALPGYRRQGPSRSVVRAVCRHAYCHGLEPQYRCHLSNTASRALAASAGLTWYGNWETALTKSST